MKQSYSVFKLKKEKKKLCAEKFQHYGFLFMAASFVIIHA